MKSFLSYKRQLIINALMLLITLSSCKKYIEVAPPTNSITEATVFDNDLTAAAVLTGLYSDMSRQGLSAPNILTISKLAGLSADEFDLWSGATQVESSYYKNSLQTISGGVSAGINAGPEFWKVCYSYIYRCNQAIEGVSSSENLSSSVKKQLLGESKFLRAFFYFYIVNFYGDAALVTGLDPKKNSLLKRSAISEVYNFIISDLKDAQQLLSPSYLNSGLAPYDSDPEKIRPTKWAATSLLARVYLFTAQYANAETEATSVINETSLFDVSSVALTDVFLKNSKEAIWQLQPVTTGWNTNDARYFNLSVSPVGFSTTKSVYLSTELYNSFEPGDNRKTAWIGNYSTVSPVATYHFASKFKAGRNSAITSTDPSSIVEYHMMLRLGEQYLIRAEARARLGNISGAVADLNVLRTRARDLPTPSINNPLPDLPNSLSQSQTIEAVMQERRVELFSEWGHRWFDLKRTASINLIMSAVAPLKGSSWEEIDQLYPLPSEDILNDPNLRQNPGY
jgi:hypothetical protein